MGFRRQPARHLLLNEHEAADDNLLELIPCYSKLRMVQIA